MTKRVSGERSLKVGRKTYKLRLDFAAIAEVEDKLNCSILELITMGNNPKMSKLIVLVSAMMKKTEDDVIQIIQTVGIEPVLTVALEVFAATFADPDGEDQGEAKAGTAA